MKTLILASVLLIGGCVSWTPEQRHNAEVIAISVAATSIALSVDSEHRRECDHIGCYNHSHGIGPQVQP